MHFKALYKMSDMSVDNLIRTTLKGQCEVRVRVWVDKGLGLG